MSITCPHCQEKIKVMPLSPRKILPSGDLPIYGEIQEYFDYLSTLAPLTVTSDDLVNEFRLRYPSSKIGVQKLAKQLRRLGLSKSIVIRGKKSSQRAYRLVKNDVTI